MLRPLGLLTSLALITVARAAAAEASLPDYNAYFAAASSPARAPLASAARAQAIITSTDPQRGVPTFLWAPRGADAPPPASTTDPARAARFYLARYADLYGLAPDALATAEVQRIHDTGTGGIIVVLRQAPAGIEVFHHDAKVLLDRSLGLVALSGSLHPAARAGLTPRFALGRAEALARALQDLEGMTVPASSFGNERRAPGGYHLFDLSPGPALVASKIELSRPARIKQVFFPLPDRIVPAYYLELFAGRIDGTDSGAHGYVIAADDGRVLHRANLVQSDVYKYRVWADPTGNRRPLDGPIADFSPSPSGVPDDVFPPFIPPVLVSMEAFNKNPGKQVDPWLFPGATETSGNNVDAYTDHASPDGYSNGDLRATTTGEKTFDRVYDVHADPLASAEQSMAAVTQLFYTTNWLHDYWYDSGFDEAAGNAQKYNGDRGGLEGDALLAEAQDGALEGALNNANMSTPADGASPRMQMYLWSGPEARSVVAQPGNLALTSASADFGPGTFDLTGTVALADDGVPVTADGCEPIVNDVAGKIALVHRGMCSFKLKAVNAQAAGAVGLLLANNQPGAGPFPAGDDPVVETEVTIPVIPISLEDGAALEAALLAGQVTISASRTQGTRPDGTIDNPVVAHEWGHYLHHRLVDCNTLQCAGHSEGWGDFAALFLMVRPGDDLQGAYSSSIYATLASPSAAYYGLRRAPYSVDFTKDPFTFKHIADDEPLPEGAPLLFIGGPNSEVHNAGEIWTAMLFEGYVGLLQRSLLPDPPYSFETARRRMADYIVAGMTMTPPEPTYNEQRDALLAAAFAADPDDMLVLAKGFARRGLGSCAVSPDKGTSDNTGLTESFDVLPSVQILAVTLDDSVLSCDTDGALDAEETGVLTLEIANAGVSPLTQTSLHVTTTTPGVTFPMSADFTVGPVDPFGKATVKIPVALDPTIAKQGPLDLDLSVKSPGACAPSIELTRTFRINYDDTAAASATDRFDGGIDVWTPAGEPAKGIWSKAEIAPLQGAWHGADVDGRTDTWLVSPELTVSDTESLILTLQHRHSFEASPENEGGPDTYWDGAVIEVSTNGGKNWKDLNLYGDPGYGGVITTQSNNPLGNRMAFVGKNASWPKTDEVTIDLGTKLAGTKLLLRFRIGTDEAANAEGWDLDSVGFKGIVGTPFPAVVDDGKICNRPPVADAGSDRTVKPGAAILLDASKSADPDGDPLTFTWSQVSGPTVAIDAAGPKAIVIAPSVEADADLVFQVVVDDGKRTATDTVSVLVRGSAPDAPGDLVAGGGCSCEAAGSGDASTLPALAAAALLVARRRRRARA